MNTTQKKKRSFKRKQRELSESGEEGRVEREGEERRGEERRGKDIGEERRGKERRGEEGRGSEERHANF